MRSGVPAALLLCLVPAAAQVRCSLNSVRRADGSYQISPNCEHLLLFGQNIGDDGATKLAAALGGAKRLQFLDLWSNGIGPKGARVRPPCRLTARRPLLQNVYVRIRHFVLSVPSGWPTARTFENTHPRSVMV